MSSKFNRSTTEFVKSGSSWRLNQTSCSVENWLWVDFVAVRMKSGRASQRWTCQTGMAGTLLNHPAQTHINIDIHILELSTLSRLSLCSMDVILPCMSTTYIACMIYVHACVSWDFCDYVTSVCIIFLQWKKYFKLLFACVCITYVLHQIINGFAIIL